MLNQIMKWMHLRWNYKQACKPDTKDVEFSELGQAITCKLFNEDWQMKTGR